MIEELRAERSQRLWLIVLYLTLIGATLTISAVLARWLYPLA